MPSTTAFSYPAAQARLGALLSAQVDRLDVSVEELTADVARAYTVGPATVRGWLADEPVLVAAHLRALISALRLPRQQVLDHVAPAALLPALWCRPVGEALRTARENAGLSQRALCELTGVSEATLNRWEKAQTAPRTGRLAPVLAALELSASDLVALGDWPPAELPIGDRPAFATWVRAARHRSGKSVQRFAHDLGLAFATVQAWEAGRAYPAVASWTTLADRLTDLGHPISADQLRAMQLPEWVSDTELTTRPPFAQVLTRARMARRHSIDITAHHLGVDEATYRSWETGTGYPRTAQFPAVAAALRTLGVKTSVRSLTAMRPFEQHPDSVLAQLPAVAALLASARMGAALPVAEVAALCGCADQTYASWEAGHTLPGEEAWPVLVSTLNLPAGELVEALQEQRFGSRRDRGTLIWATATANGVGARALADMLGVHRNWVTAFTQGRSGVTDAKATAAALALGVDPSGFMAAPATPDTDFRATGARFAQARERLGLNQAELGTLVGVHQASISGYESGQTSPSQEVLARLEAVFAAA